MQSPTLDGYIQFLRNVVGISVSVLPDSSIYIGYSYNVSLMWVNRQLKLVCAQPGYASLYAIAVYNLATDRLINYAQDLSGAPVYQDDLPYFKYLRSTYKLDAPVMGAVTSTSDEGTSVSLSVPKSIAEDLTFDNLQRMKTPWGREYLGLVQSLGPSIWGLT